MASVNKVILVGNLGRDPETRYLPNGDPVCNFSIATTDNWKDKATGERKERTEWHNIVIYRKLAEIAQQYLKKGRPVYIEGSLHTRKWEKDGITRYTTEIIATSMQMLGSKDSAPSNSANQSAPQPQAQQPATTDQEFEDDIPF